MKTSSAWVVSSKWISISGHGRAWARTLDSEKMDYGKIFLVTTPWLDPRDGLTPSSSYRETRNVGIARAKSLDLIGSDIAPTALA